MNTTKKIAIGIGVASGALLAAWLLTGSRREKTKQFFTGKAAEPNEAPKKEKTKFDDSESYYI